MHKKPFSLRDLFASMPLIAALGVPCTRAADILYIGDLLQDDVTVIDSGIQRLDAETGALLDGPASKGYFIKDRGCTVTDTFTGSLCGPGGVVTDGGRIVVGNGNANRSPANDERYPFEVPAEIQVYKRTNGELTDVIGPAVITDSSGKLVPNPKALTGGPSQGLIIWEDRILAAVLSDTPAPGKSCSQIIDPALVDCPPGYIAVYDRKSGKRLAKVVPQELSADQFHPRGMVIGPDKKLYVAVRNFLPNPGFNLGGHVLRFDPRTLQYLGAVIADPDGTKLNFNRPDGVVFGPDGKMYVATFRKDPTDTDKVMIFKNGKMIGHIDLSPSVASSSNEERAFTSGILFGPKGRLYVPIAGPTPPNIPVLGIHTGEIRAYDVRDISTTTPHYDLIVPSKTANPKGPLIQPSYFTFGKTNPSTLVYGND